MSLKRYIEAGEVVTTHGVLGEVKVYPWADSAEFLQRLDTFFLSPEGGGRRKVTVSRVHKRMLLVKFEEIDSVEDARALIGRTLYLDRQAVQLPEGRYFVQDIVGLVVRDALTGEEYGRVTAVTSNGANDVYQIEKEGQPPRLFPAVPEFLGELKPEEGYLTVRPIEGMFTDAD